jgi:hypothetical protein
MYGLWREMARASAFLRVVSFDHVSYFLYMPRNHHHHIIIIISLMRCVM